MGLLEKIWEFITSVIPVERWIRAIGNVLRFLSLAFILLIGLVIILIFGNWGFTSEQRFQLILCCFGLIFLVLILGVLLALLPGGALYSPKERALSRGKRYGTNTKPRMLKEIPKLPQEPLKPQLPTKKDVGKI